ncbi:MULTISPECIES: M3 family metallopeptidase [Actinosynnema]|uniref:M3 family metallopeptidase n=1 Tax=Actinosynnema TaxID=40566 RepID=UPI0020A42D15|nr:M3 family metallopeptidase [Actinosynnema pretiosum]
MTSTHPTSPPRPNPLLDPDFDSVPPLARVRAEHLVPALHLALQRREQAIALVAADTDEPTAGNTLDALATGDALLLRVGRVLSILLQAASTPQVRQAQEAYDDLVAAQDLRARSDPALRLRLRALAARTDLTTAQRWLIERMLTASREQQDGDLPEHARRAVRDLQEREGRLERRASELIDRATHRCQVLVEHELTELTGLGAGQRRAARAAALAAGREGWLLPLDAPLLQPLLARLDDPAVREVLHRASLERGQDPRLREAVTALVDTRARLAHAHRHPHHAAWTLQEQGAGSLERVERFVAALLPPTVAAAHRDDATLAALARRHGLPLDEHGRARAWDRPWLADHTRQDAGLDGEELARHLELGVVLTGAFELAEKVFGVGLVEVHDPDLAYAPGVRTWRAHDLNQGDRPLGILLLDPAARTGKRPGGWTVEVQARSHVPTAPALAAVCLSLPTPDDGGPLLLTPQQAATTWHEIGHALHALLTDTGYAQASYVHLPRDLVEVPGVLLEMACLDPRVITGWARDHNAGTPLPAATADHLAAALRAGAAEATAAMLGTVLLDLAAHTRTSTDTDPLDLDLLQHQALAEAGLADTGVAPRYHWPMARHLWTGGYESRFYGYLWADAVAAGLLEALVTALGHGPDAPQARTRLRKLFTGGAAHPERYPAPDPAALLERLGLLDHTGSTTGGDCSP